MSIKPILFNTDMVRAILDGRKTVTRRLIKKLPDDAEFSGWLLDSTCQEDAKDIGSAGFKTLKQPTEKAVCVFVKPPYQPGDILYVRETWREHSPGFPNLFIYKADYRVCKVKWKPSIHMPKEAARIWLKVKDVRVERLQECGKGWCLDIEKEGVVTPQSPILYINDDRYHDALREEFQKLWDSTIKKSDLDRYGWDANPWVWVIEFELCEKPE